MTAADADDAVDAHGVTAGRVASRGRYAAAVPGTSPASTSST
jgi:hypothetical protein